MGVTAIELYREPRALTRAGEDARAICESWAAEPEGARFAESLITFLGSKTNPGTQRVYALALYEFFAWAQRAKGTMPLPNQVLRVDAARFTKWLEERQASLDEDRLALEPGRELDAEIIRFVRGHSDAGIGAVRRHLLANDLFACDVTFTTKGAEAMAFPFSSVAMAASVVAPTAVGAQTIDQIPAASVALPMSVPLVKTCTELTAPSASVALSVSVVLNPTGKKAPVAGVTNATVGGLPITLAISIAMGAEVLVRPLLSTTRAVSTCAPDWAGAVKSKVYGATRSVPIRVPFK